MVLCVCGMPAMCELPAVCEYLSFAIVEITHGVTANRDDINNVIN